LALTGDQLSDGNTKHRGVTACLNRAYWGISDEEANRILIGSWGKGTRVRPPRDIDLLFILPVDVYWRFQGHTGNKQSDLLQEVKGWLQQTYPQTELRGDGQVVVVPFNTYRIEVAPSFVRQGSGYIICDSNAGGSYKHADPGAELAYLAAHDTAYNGNVRKLARILKQWQRFCNVPIKSFHLEALIMEILPRINYGDKHEYWYDWLVRDVLGHIVSRANGGFTMPATAEVITLGDAWLSRAESAYTRALKACEFERDNQEELAGDEWQKIFGTMIPKTVDRASIW